MLDAPGTLSKIIEMCAFCQQTIKVGHRKESNPYCTVVGDAVGLFFPLKTHVNVVWIKGLRNSMNRFKSSNEVRSFYDPNHMYKNSSVTTVVDVSFPVFWPEPTLKPCKVSWRGHEKAEESTRDCALLFLDVFLLWILKSHQALAVVLAKQDSHERY